MATHLLFVSLSLCIHWLSHKLKRYSMATAWAPKGIRACGPPLGPRPRPTWAQAPLLSIQVERITCISILLLELTWLTWLTVWLPACPPPCLPASVCLADWLVESPFVCILALSWRTAYLFHCVKFFCVDLQDLWHFCLSPAKAFKRAAKPRRWGPRRRLSEGVRREQSCKINGDAYQNWVCSPFSLSLSLFLPRLPTQSGRAACHNFVKSAWLNLVRVKDFCYPLYEIEISCVV